MTFRPPIPKFRRMRSLRRRAMRIAWMKQSRDDCILRWHGNTLAQLEYGWRNMHRMHVPFVPGLYLAPQKRKRMFITELTRLSK